jgi:alkylhydroperoxidase family enzyme
MTGIDPLPVEHWPPEMADALAAMTPPNHRYSLRGPKDGPRATNIVCTFAHHPNLARAFLTFNGHLLRATTLTERQREIVILRTAAVCESEYEWVQHLFLGRDAGITDGEIAWIAWGPEAPVWDPVEANLLRAVDELIGHGEMSKETFGALKDQLDIQQLLDAIFTVGAYQTLAWMLEAFEIKLDDGLLSALSAETTQDDQ